jgi:hypothetical protein
LTFFRRNLLSILTLAAACLVLTACPQRESIAKINLDPARYSNKEISIAGRVTNSFGALGHGVYQLDDGTGEMWVFSERFGIPGNDAKVAVVGRVQQGFSFGGRNFATILIETERRH